VEWQTSSVVVDWPAQYPAAFVYRSAVYDYMEPTGPTTDK
jgi:hypothetical protein